MHTVHIITFTILQKKTGTKWKAQILSNLEIIYISIGITPALYIMCYSSMVNTNFSIKTIMQHVLQRYIVKKLLHC